MTEERCSAEVEWVMKFCLCNYLKVEVFVQGPVFDVVQAAASEKRYLFSR